MNEHIKNATDYAFNNNVADMQAELESALQYKIINALEQQKIEMAQTLMNTGVSESHEKKLKGNQAKLDVAEPKGKLTAADFKKLRKEGLDEKLTAGMPASKVIQDFVHSDDPKFKGKSKKERIKMALGAFYGMNPEKARNEEVEEIEELSKDTLSSYRDKASKAAEKHFDYATKAAQRGKSSETPRFLKHSEKFGKRTAGVAKASEKIGKNV